MRLRLAALLCTLVSPVAADAALTDTRAFEHAYAESFYRFDACGDPVTGVMFRRALGRKLAACPFTEAARDRFAERADAQERKSAQLLQRMIDEHGGLPVKLDGMSRTCREQVAAPEYQDLRALLEQEAARRTPPETVFPAACDADGM